MEIYISAVLTLLFCVVLVSADTANPRPQLPHCKCKEGRWTNSDDEPYWAKNLGADDPNVTAIGGVAAAKDWWGHGVPIDAEGCTDLGVVYGEEAGTYLVCLPDMNDGPCVGFGNYNYIDGHFLMACNDATTNAAPKMNKKERKAAAYTEYMYGDLVPSPPCECSDDMATSAIAGLFCGTSATLLETASTSEVCASTPMNFNENMFNNSGEVTWGRIEPLVPEGKSWCKIDSLSCSTSTTKFTDPCTGEHGMVTPNTDKGLIQQQNAYEFAGALMYYSQTVDAYIAISLSCGPIYLTAMTFMPQNAIPSKDDLLYDTSGVEGKDMNTKFGFSEGFKGAIAASKATYKLYDAPKNPAGDAKCDDECEINLLRFGASAVKAIAERAQKCSDNEQCAEMRKMTSCHMIMKHTMEANRPDCEECQDTLAKVVGLEKCGQVCAKKKGTGKFKKCKNKCKERNKLAKKADAMAKQKCGFKKPKPSKP